MPEKAFTATITPKAGAEPLGKLFLRKKTYSDHLNNCPTEMHVYIPLPTQAHPHPNVQLWIRNGGGKVLIRFKNPETLADCLRELADIITTDEALDEFLHAEDISSPYL